jgi:hypothetical protein
MNRLWTVLAASVPFLGSAQTGIYAYHPSGNDFFKLQAAHVTSTVIGPVVRTQTDLTYANPFPGSSQVSFNFALPETSVLGGFRCSIGGRMVKARLAQKDELGPVSGSVAMASVRQASPMFYTCELGPLVQGREFRIRIWTVGLVQPRGDRMLLPKPSLDLPVKAGTSTWNARSVDPASLKCSGGDYTIGRACAISAVAQRFPKDDRYYVAGYFRADRAVAPTIKIEHAYYEPADGSTGGKDVTSQVADTVKHGGFFIWASDTAFGDPCPNVHKRLRVVAEIAGEELTVTTPQNETMNLLGRGGSLPNVYGLFGTRTVFEDPRTVAFYGWTPKPGPIKAQLGTQRFETRPRVVRRGSDIARLWAQQFVASGVTRSPNWLRAFSRKYRTLTSVTALITTQTGDPAPPLLRSH